MTIAFLTGIARVAAPTVAEFERCYRAPGVPVVFTGAIEHWPARTGWSMQSLAVRCGDTPLPTARTRRGMLDHDARTGVNYTKVPLHALTHSLGDAAGPELYMTCAIDDELPALGEDVRPYPYTAGALWMRRRIWVGPRGAASPMHHDLAENLYAQLVGRKRMLLFSPEQTRRMYPFAWYSALPNFAAVDAENPDLARHPKFRGACGVSVDLDPGDVLYLPRLWWHQARTLDASISVNVWWTRNVRLAATLRAAELYKRARGLRM